MRILITGASGMLGATLVDKWQSRFELFATDKNNFAENQAKNFLEFDLLSKSYNTLMDWAKPEVIIHCAAITNVNYCEEFPQQAMAVNAESVEKFIQADSKARMIFISSDSVFPDGLNLASEKDPASPINVYGSSKVVGEKSICDVGVPHVAVRTTIVGKNINPSYQGFLEWIVNSIRSGKKLTLFDDALFTPISIWHLTDELEWIFKNDIFGIIHIAGKEQISKYEFGKKICEKLILNTSLIHKGSIDDFNFKAKRSKDQTLDSGCYENLSGRSLPSTNETVDMIVKHFKEFNFV